MLVWAVLWVVWLPLVSVLGDWRLVCLHSWVWLYSPNHIQHNLNPSAAEQYTETRSRVKTIKNKERVIVDRNLTLQSIYSLWYWWAACRTFVNGIVWSNETYRCVNVGSLSGIATTFIERHIGFWAAYLLSACFLWFGVVLLLFGRRKFGSQVDLAHSHFFTLTEPSSAATQGIGPETGLQSVLVCNWRKIQDGCGKAWFSTYHSWKRSRVEWFFHRGAQIRFGSLPRVVRPSCSQLFEGIFEVFFCADIFLV